MPRRFSRRCLTLLFLLSGAPLHAQPPRFQDKVDVERALLEVRVVDEKGDPVLGLTPSDFRVRIDGRPVVLESAHWISGTEPSPERHVENDAGTVQVQPSEARRLIVFFFQKDMHPSRMAGLLRMQQEALRLLRALGPEDRVAVLTFDSHLRLRLDFTNDPARLAKVVGNAVRLPDTPPLPAGPFPSLAATLDVPAARNAATPETALLVTAHALRPLPGTKSLIFFGWGMGRFGATGVRMEADYGPARRALTEARVTVFALDVTDADYHSLEVGLEQVSEDTGGFYLKTHLFARSAVRRVERALLGHYLLAFERPPLERGTYSLRVDLVRRKGTVLSKTLYEG